MEEPDSVSAKSQGLRIAVQKLNLVRMSPKKRKSRRISGSQNAQDDMIQSVIETKKK